MRKNLDSSLMSIADVKGIEVFVLVNVEYVSSFISEVLGELLLIVGWTVNSRFVRSRGRIFDHLFLLLCHQAALFNPAKKSLK